MTSSRISRLAACAPAVMLSLSMFCSSSAFAADSPASSSETAEASPKEMLKSASASIGHMREMVGQMEALLKQVEERGDADAARCVRDKLAASRAVVDVAVLSQNTMQELLAQNKSGLASAEFRKIEALLGKVEQFLAEAQACAGDPTHPVGSVEREATKETGTKEDLRSLTAAADDNLQPYEGTPFE